jgi:hypothetical protein
LVCASTPGEALITMFEPAGAGTSHTTVPPAFFWAADVKVIVKGLAACAVSMARATASPAIRAGKHSWGADCA